MLERDSLISSPLPEPSPPSKNPAPPALDPGLAGGRQSLPQAAAVAPAEKKESAVPPLPQASFAPLKKEDAVSPLPEERTTKTSPSFGSGGELYPGSDTAGGRICPRFRSCCGKAFRQSRRRERLRPRHCDKRPVRRALLRRKLPERMIL